MASAKSKEYGEWDLPGQVVLPKHLEVAIDELVEYFDVCSPVKSQVGWDRESVIEFCVMHRLMSVKGFWPRHDAVAVREDEK